MINLEGMSVSIIQKLFKGQAIKHERKLEMADALSVLLARASPFLPRTF